MLTLSVLDQSPIRTGGTPAEAIAETIELARAAERLGYHRYWLAEHHNAMGLACTAPEIMVARIAAVTGEMHVGTGGVMLPHYSALKVAEIFRMLETLYPGRIDLGIGRAPGSDQRTAQALQAGPGALGAEYYPYQVRDLMAYLSDDLPADHPFAAVHAQPMGPSEPELWILGSSDQSAAVAAHFGTAFSFAHFINHVGGDAVMRAYHEAFKPSARLAEPRGSVGVFVICADTEDEAKRLALSRDLWRLRLDKGEIGPFPSVGEAERYPFSDEERTRIAYNRNRYIVGAPEQVRDALLKLCQAYRVDEAVVVTICHEFAPRLRSYELLAEAFELAPRSVAGRD